MNSLSSILHIFKTVILSPKQEPIERTSVAVAPTNVPNQFPPSNSALI